ncbi:MAG: hypothetical protein RL648_1833 [Verrucomicrobiota bacterium]
MKANASGQGQVIIVGAGPVGLAAALSLKERGIPTEVLERDDRPGTHSYALALHPSTVRQLRQWGLLDAVRGQSLQVKKILFYDAKQPRYELDFDAIPGLEEGLHVLGQDHLERTLLEPLKAGGVPIRWSHRLSRFEDQGDAVKLELERLSESMSGYAMARLEWHVDKEISRHADYMIGADGHFSLVRRRMGIAFPKVAPTQSFAVFEFKTDFAHENTARVVFGPQGTSILWPLPGGFCRWGFEIEESSADAISREKDRLFVQVGAHGYHALEAGSLDHFLEERAPWFTGEVGPFRWRMVVRFERRLVGKFGSGRVWLAGDAAHLAAPIGMQSMNVGIQEGYQLGQALADILEERKPSSVLEAYGRAREEEWQALLGMETALRPRGETDPFVAENSDKMMACLPASLETLPLFAEHLRMDLLGSTRT